MLLLGVFPRGEKADDTIRDAHQGDQRADRQARRRRQDREVPRHRPQVPDEDGTLTKEIMPDALHPNEKGYQIWADAIGAAGRDDEVKYR